MKLLKHSTSSSLLSINEKNRCFTEITNILNITDLPLASYKSTKANTYIFWQKKKEKKTVLFGRLKNENNQKWKLTFSANLIQLIFI